MRYGASRLLRGAGRADRVQKFQAPLPMLEKLAELVAALRDCLSDAQVANLRGRARLQAIGGSCAVTQGCQTT